MLEALLVPALIFTARVIDVSIGTVKLILMSKGMKKIVPLLAFIEISVWLVTITKVLENLNDPVNYVAYALGFAAGTWVGMKIEEMLAMGTTVIQVILKKDGGELFDYLISHGYPATKLGGAGPSGQVDLIFTIVRRNKVPQALFTIRQFNPHAFYSIEDVNFASELIGPLDTSMKDRIRSSISVFRKAK